MPEMAPDNDNIPKRSSNMDFTNTTMGECVRNHQNHNYKDRVSDIENEGSDIVEESRTNCKESQTSISNTREDTKENIKTEKDLHTQNEEANKPDAHNASSLSECSILSHQDVCDNSDKNNNSEPDLTSTDSDDDSSAPVVLPMRPGFKPKGRMFRAAAPTSAPEVPSFIMDVPQTFGIMADGSMMEAFNRFEIKD